ncbi:GNAT family N-acetyltransferase [Pseudomonas peli]|uniref:GNAT family N-acetyltransferase n=1 Tax=Pseudomonas peli TaxID=592361 RepID=UPI0024ADCC64|nr:GNAT family N-acetyltransferase [Pseudomonas peli]
MIYNIKEKPELIPVIAEWHHQEWSSLSSGMSLQARIKKMQSYLSNNKIPGLFVWFDSGCVVGSAGILVNDMDTKPALTPWLASLYVVPDQRGRGIGTALVNHVMQYAKTLGNKEIFLFTPSKENFYSDLGWEVISREEYRGQKVSVMRFKFNT